jgi:hypothetical protein
MVNNVLQVTARAIRAHNKLANFAVKKCLKIG